MREVKFTVPGKPQGKARAKTYHTNSITRTVTPEKTVLYENFIKERFIQTADGFFVDKGNPVHVTVNVSFTPPKNTSKKRYVQMLNGEIPPLKKPDADNIVKVVCDALNGVAYHDDSQVIFVACAKRYSATEGLEITLLG